MNIASLKMPRLGETMEQGEIVGWLVKVGQPFQRGDPILEVETDKTVVEYPALGDGVLVEILTPEGTLVAVGDTIARIDLGAGVDWTNTDTTQMQSRAAAPPDNARSAPPVTPEVKVLPDSAAGRPRATPVARKLARIAGIDLASLTGTGRRSRIEARDVPEVSGSQDIRFSGDIAYSDTGPTQGAGFLLIHGFAGDHTTFAVLTNGLKRAGARVVACDLPGHGATRIKAATADDLFSTLGGFARAVFDGQPFHLVAHSLGTVPALALASEVAPTSLTLIAPVGLAALGNVEFLTGMAAPASPQALKRLLNMLTQQPVALSDSAIDAIYTEQSRARLVDLAANLGSDQHPIMPRLEQLARKLPVRLLIGQNDRIVGQADLDHLPPEIAVHSFADTGHMPHWENPKAVLKILLAAAQR